MSKTKNVVIDDQNKKNEEAQANSQSKDFNRLSGEAIGKLCDATHDAMKELQGDNSVSDAVCNSELYCSLFPLSVMACNHYFKREKAKLSYLKMEMGELLKELYLRMQMYYNYGECKGRDLPGIAWHMEPTGVFAITLRDCAVNMEQPFKEESWDRPARLFAIGLNLTLLESEDPEDEGSHLAGEYDEFVTFTCEVRDPGTGESECRDIYPSPNHCNEEAIRSILGSLDLISKMTENKH